MRRIQSGIAVLCVCLLVAPLAAAQQIQYVQDSPGGPLSGLTHPYEPKTIAPVDLANSNRLDSLLRAGNIYLSLQDAIALALENNLDIHIQRYGRPQAEASLLRARAGGPLRGVPTSVQSSTTSGLSQITGSSLGSASVSGGGASSASSGGTIITATGTNIPSLDPSFYAVGYWAHQTQPQSNTLTTGTTSLIYRNDYYSAGYQQSFLSGTNMNLGWTNQITTANTGVPEFNPSTTGSLNLQFTQHLLQGFGFAVNNRNIRIARNNLQVTDLVFRQQVIGTVSAVIQAYWDLVSFNEAVRVNQQAVDLAQRLYEDNKKQVEIGTLAPIEIVRAEAQVASSQQQLVNAQTLVLQQETGLKNALSRTGVESPAIADAHIIPTDHITVPATEPVVPIQDLMQKAIASRPEIAESRINIDSTKIGLVGSRHEMLPSLDLIANLGNNALAGTVNAIPSPYGTPHAGDPFFVGGQGKVFSQLFGRNFPNYALGVQLNVPLRNRAAQADYILDSLTLRTQQLQQQRLINAIRVDVRNALIAAQQASASYQAAVKARILQEQTLEAEQKKYALGASTIFVIIQYQRDLAQARSNEVAAVSAYAKAKVQLDAAVGGTLETYNISIDEAVKGRVSRPPSTVPVQ